MTTRKLIHWSMWLAALAMAGPQVAFGQDGGSSEPPCASDDIPCQIIRMDPKPGGGSGGGITNGERQEFDVEKFKMDLGAKRVPSEQMRLPELKQFEMNGAPM